MIRKVEVSHRTIVFAVLFLLSLGFLYFIRDIILSLFVALLLTTILEPLVVKMTKFKIPRAVSVILSYILFLGIFGGMIALVVPTLVDQTTSFVNALPVYFSNLGIASYINGDVSREILSKLGGLPSEMFKFTISIFSNLLSVLTVFVFSFYMLQSENGLRDQLSSIFGDERREDLTKTIDEIESKLGAWARGQLILMFLVGVSTYVGLVLIGIPFALPLAIIAGLLEIVPTLGPIVAAIPSIVIGFGISPLVGVITAILTIVIQQVENYVLVPKVMQKSTGVSPLVTLVSLAIGTRLAGVVGAIISIPVVITLQILFKRYLIKD